MARYHGFTGIGGGYGNQSDDPPTFTTKAAAREWLREEKAYYADFAADSDAADNGEDRLRLYGNVRNLDRVGIEGGMAFVRESWVEFCPYPDCEICRDYDEQQE
jgi:hypothetical protein